MPRIVSEARYSDIGRATEMYLQPRLQRVGPDRVVTTEIGETRIGQPPRSWIGPALDPEFAPERGCETRVFRGVIW